MRYACFQSPAYQAAREYRLPVAEGEIVIVEGMVKERPAQAAGKGYWVARYDVRDATVYKKYVEASAAVFVEYEALFSRARRPEPGDGRAGARA